METKDIILELRTKKGMSQDELAEKVFVTRQAVSRWETGETTPNTETLKLLSKLFDVSINTLLGSPRQLICQCCGMPLEGVRQNVTNSIASLGSNMLIVSPGSTNTGGVRGAAGSNEKLKLDDSNAI